MSIAPDIHSPSPFASPAHSKAIQEALREPVNARLRLVKAIEYWPTTLSEPTPLKRRGGLFGQARRSR